MSAHYTPSSGEEYEVIPYGYDADGALDVHSATGFCNVDPSCGCHEDPMLIDGVNELVQGGLLTPDEATRRVGGWHL